jgi:serine/threonine protein kinase
MYFERGATNLRQFLQLTHAKEPGIMGRGGPSVHTLCYISYGIARILDALHAMGIYHGDIKLANVVLDWLGRVMLIDMGMVSMRKDYWHLANLNFYIAPELHSYFDGATEHKCQPVSPIHIDSRLLF